MKIRRNPQLRILSLTQTFLFYHNIWLYGNPSDIRPNLLQQKQSNNYLASLAVQVSVVLLQLLDLALQQLHVDGLELVGRRLLQVGRVHVQQVRLDLDRWID